MKPYLMTMMLWIYTLSLLPLWANDSVRVRFTTVNALSGEGLDARVKLVHKGEALLPDGEYDYRRWFLVKGEQSVTIPAGEYTIFVSKGLEWHDTVEKHSILENGQTIELKLQRWVDMNAQGWWSGDLHIHRPLDVMEDLVRIEGINVAPVLTFWNHTSMFEGDLVPKPRIRKAAARQYYSILNEEHERQDGAVLLFNLKEMLDVRSFDAWYPDALQLMEDAHVQDAHVEIEKPFWNDYPLWLALGAPHSVGVVCNHFQAEKVMNNPAWGRPRGEDYPKEPLGLALYVMDLYYKALNCGFRVAATGGGASGVLDNPVGQNRTYIYLGGRFSYRRWFDALRRGNSVATNGPMLIARVNGKYPGHEFDADDALHLELEAQSKHGIQRVEWIADGIVVKGYQYTHPLKNIRLEERISARPFHWIAARVFEDSEPQVVRFAQTSPFYIDNGEPSVRYQEDVHFFLNWLDERIEQSHDPALIPDDEEREKRIYNLRRAKAVFMNQLTQDYRGGGTVFYYGEEQEQAK